MMIYHAYGGALRSDCPWYVTRREDARVLDLLAEGENCYVLTSHQMGKSSLVVRLVDQLRTSGHSAVAVDLAAFGSDLNACQWYNALAHRVGRQLHLEDEFEDFWTAHPHLSPFDRFYQTLEQVAFERCSGRLFFFVDEIDLLRSLPFEPTEFLEAIQAAGNPEQADCKRIVYCLLGTVSPAELWQGSPREAVNLGRITVLRDFGRDDLDRIIQYLGEHLEEHPDISWHERLYTPEFILEQSFDRVFFWTNGHPYLTQKLGCATTFSISHHLAGGSDLSPGQHHDLVDHLCDMLFTSARAREQDCHFLWIRQRLLSHGWDASRLFDLCSRGEFGVDLNNADHQDIQSLIALGVFRVHNGRLTWRNRIYERVFASPWLSGNGGPVELTNEVAPNRTLPCPDLNELKEIKVPSVVSCA